MNPQFHLTLPVFLSIITVSTAQLFSDFYRDFETKIFKTKIPDTNIFKDQYDFIIIGAGSAGCVIANRLSEIPSISVLLLEAGDQETFINQIPLTAAITSITRYNWGYKTEPEQNACHGLTGGVCSWPKGRGIGGTSLVNFMVYSRGHSKDYDNWAKLGNVGWSYDEVLPYFKKSENIGIPELKNSYYHGITGSLDVTYPPFVTPLLNAFLKTGYDIGYNISDPNGEEILGFSRVQANLRNGQRCSTGKAFIAPIIYRRNLAISMQSRVTKILINPVTKEVDGVEFLKYKVKYVVKATKEVILSAGVIASPQLLMLSGIGPKEDLENLEIPVIKDLRVGYNLQDHISLPAMTFLVNESITIVEREVINPKDILEFLVLGRGKYTSPGGAEGYAFVRTANSDVDLDYANLEIVLGAGSLNNDMSGTLRNLVGIPDEFYNTVFKGVMGKHSYGMVPILLDPKSRGRVSLKTKNPFDWPKMVANYLQHPDDIRTLIDGINLVIKISQSKHFKKFGSVFHTTPYLGCESYQFGSDDYWKCCLRKYGISLQHQVGTCKMGPSSDLEAVVNPKLQVYGIKNLRVADASIIPVLPAGHTNAIVIMIGEKAADIVKNHWGLKDARIDRVYFK